MQRYCGSRGATNMSAVLITGSAGLIGSEAAQFYCRRGHPVIGIDNDLRSHFFGQDASTRWKRNALMHELPAVHPLRRRYAGSARRRADLP